MEESGIIARLGSGHVLQHLSLPLSAFSLKVMAIFRAEVQIQAH